MNKYNVILDSDPGHDDAIAILLLGSSDIFNCLGVTTVRGNQTIEKTTSNALNIIQYLNLPFKVYQGRSEPLFRKSPTCSQIHGDSGLDGFTFPPLKREKEELDGVSFIIKSCLENEHVTLIPTGPLSNIGDALRMEPKIKNNIDRIILMGGSIGKGNITDEAEFNILTDPEAADIVFKSQIPIYMVGLDVTRRCLITDKLIERMSYIKNPAGILFHDLMKVFLENQISYFHLSGAPLHDPLTVACMIDPSILSFTPAEVIVDTSFSKYEGKTYVSMSNAEKYNAYVATDVDVDKYFDLIETSLKVYDRLNS